MNDKLEESIPTNNVIRHKIDEYYNNLTKPIIFDNMPFFSEGDIKTAYKAGWYAAIKYINLLTD